MLTLFSTLYDAFILPLLKWKCKHSGQQHHELTLGKELCKKVRRFSFLFCLFLC